MVETEKLHKIINKLRIACKSIGELKLSPNLSEIG